jgi:Zn-dependent metalloprotease
VATVHPINHAKSKTSPCPRPQACFLPPSISGVIAERGSLAQRRRAIATLQLDQSFRSARQGRQLETRLRRGLRRRVQARPAWLSLLQPSAGRTVYDADSRHRLPGQEARSEGDPLTGDDAVDEAYDHLGSTFDFYLDAYGRNSIDDAGLSLDGTTHFAVDYDNAFWDGSRMVFGDGDGDLFNRFTIPVDVVGHELTHGVVDYEGGLVYWGQSGALNESMADVFGSLIKQWTRQEKAEDADWLIGEGLLTDNVNGVALRSMADPGTAYDDPVLGKDTQPAHMDNYDHTFSDNGGVHANSGIPNHAFYLAATTLGGFSWEKAGLVWYEVLTGSQLTRTSQFQTFATLTVQAATRLFPGSTTESTVIREAWADVGIRA